MSRPGTFRKGYDPRRGPGGGKKGRSGRKPDAWKAIMAKCLTRKSTLRALSRVLKDDKHPAYLGALRFAAGYAYGKPQENVQVKGRLSLEAILARSWRKKRPNSDGGEPTISMPAPAM